MKKKGNSVFAKKFVASYKQDRLIFFPYDLVTVNNCLSDTLKKTKSGTNSRLQTIPKDNLSKLIFARLTINSIRNKFDSVTDVIKDNIDVNIVNILMLSETKEDHSFLDGQFF